MIKEVCCQRFAVPISWSPIYVRSASVRHRSTRRGLEMPDTRARYRAQPSSSFMPTSFFCFHFSCLIRPFSSVHLPSTTPKDHPARSYSL